MARTTQRPRCPPTSVAPLSLLRRAAKAAREDAQAALGPRLFIGALQLDHAAPSFQDWENRWFNCYALRQPSYRGPELD